MLLPRELRFRSEFLRPQDPQPPAEGKTVNQQAPPQGPEGGEFVTRKRDGEGRTETQGDPSKGTAPGGGTQPGTGACMDQLLLILPMLLIFYFLLIRPQQKKDKALRAMVAAAQKGDRVVMNSGLHGTITQMDDKTVTIKTDGEGKVRLTFDRAAIGRIVRDEKAG